MSSPSASQRIPSAITHIVSDKAKKLLDEVERFVEEECIPADPIFNELLGKTTAERFSAHPVILEDLKSKAKKLGLWNLWLPKSYPESAGLSNLEYGLIAEQLGKSQIASETMNCSAPDTGNMEVLVKYGNAEQKKRWLEPLLKGEIRSAFLMTEPDVASSDATNIKFDIKRDGDYYVLNGSKWWSSGAGDPRCELYIVMGKTQPDHPKVHQQQSVILVPADTKGIIVQRMLSVFGYDDAPHGHGHITFDNVRVPASGIVLGEGRGFEIVQGRLGPGRIHHAMRSIGAAEKGLEWLLARINDPSKKPFGKLLSEHGIMLERIAQSRIEIDACRLVVLDAANKIDEGGAKGALKEIAQAKVMIPRMLGQVLDYAIQAYGGAGVCQDTPLANMWAGGRTMRLVDGPDEVHLLQLARNENKRNVAIRSKFQGQRQTEEALRKSYNVPKVDRLYLGQDKSKIRSSL